MGLSIRYNGVIRQSGVDDATRAVIKEARNQGFKVIALGEVPGKPFAGPVAEVQDLMRRGLAVRNPNWDSRPVTAPGGITGAYWKANGVLIDPGEGSETFELAFMPYSPELKARLLRDGMEEFSLTTRPRIGGAKDARIEREGDVAVIEFIDRYEKNGRWRKGVDLTSLLDPESVRPGKRYIMAISQGHGLQRGEVSFLDVRQVKGGGTRHVYRFFVPFHDPKLMEQFVPGTAYLDGDTKTQCADEFLRVHAGVVAMLDAVKPHLLAMRVADDSDYWETRDSEKLSDTEEAYQTMTRGLARTLVEKGVMAESPSIVRPDEGVKPAKMEDIFKARRPREVHVREHRRRA
jgi:hypothetical protein